MHKQEKFIEIREEKRKDELKAAREIELEPFGEFVPFGIDLANMGDEDYSKLLNGAKLQQKAKVETEKKMEAERIAREKAEAEEREKIRVENERLKKEAKAKEKQIAEERAKAEAERKTIEESKAKEESRKESERKNLAAPDKKKLMEFAKTIDGLTLPELKSKEAQKVLSDAKILIAKISNFIREKSSIL